MNFIMRLYFLLALHLTSRRVITVNFIWIKMSCFLWLQNLSGLCAAIWNQFIEENQLRVESHWTESWAISEGRAWSADASFRFVDEGTPIRTTALNASGCRSHLWRNELVWRRNLVAEARFSFLRMAWIQEGSTPAYNKCSWWVGMLK